MTKTFAPSGAVNMCSLKGTAEGTPKCHKSISSKITVPPRLGNYSVLWVSLNPLVTAPLSLKNFLGASAKNQGRGMIYGGDHSKKGVGPQL